MLRVAMGLAPGLAVPLTAGAGQHEVMGRDVLPAGLVKILANMLGVRVIGCMPAHRLGPVVCCPYHLAPSHRRAGGEPARAGEQVNGFHGRPPAWRCRSPPPVRPIGSAGAGIPQACGMLRRAPVLSAAHGGAGCAASRTSLAARRILTA